MFGRGPTYTRKDCSFCKTIRIVVAMAILVLALASLTFDFGLLEGIYFTDLFAAVVGIGFFIVFGWKLWDEYLRDRIKNRDLKK